MTRSDVDAYRRPFPADCDRRSSYIADAIQQGTNTRTRRVSTSNIISRERNLLRRRSRLISRRKRSCVQQVVVSIPVADDYLHFESVHREIKCQKFGAMAIFGGLCFQAPLPSPLLKPPLQTICFEGESRYHLTGFNVISSYIFNCLLYYYSCSDFTILPRDNITYPIMTCPTVNRSGDVVSIMAAKWKLVNWYYLHWLLPGHSSIN